MKTTLQKAWKFLNGNKTIIFSTTAAILQYGVNNNMLHNSTGMKWSIGICFVLGGGSLIHHISKGYFSTKKGE
jgi:hypothetical protein